MPSNDQGWLPVAAVDDEDPIEFVAVRRGVLHRRRRVGVVLPIVVTVLGLGAAVTGQYLVVLPAVERDLQDRTTTALRDAGYGGLQARVDGRDAVLEGTLPSSQDVDRAVEVVQGVDGVRAVREVYVTGTSVATAPTGGTPSPSATPSSGAKALTVISGTRASSPGPAPVLPAAPGELVSLAALVDDGRAVIAGTLPTVAERGALIRTVTQVFGTDKVENRIVVQPTAGGIGAQSFARAVAALGPRTSAGVLSLQAGQLRVAGTVGNAGVLAAVTAAAADDIAKEPSGLVEDLTLTGEAADAAAVAAEIAALPSIPFADRSSTLGPAGRSLLSLVVDVLEAHPDVAVTVEAHVAAGDEDAAVLSSQRAGAVAAALQEAGIPGARLRARGLGTDQPAVLGATPASDAWNRRVVFLVS